MKQLVLSGLFAAGLLLSGKAAYAQTAVQIESPEELYQDPTETIVEQAPPAIQVEVAPVCVRPNILIPGHWNWQNRWIWVPGYCHVVRRGYVWVGPRVVIYQGRFVHLPGRFVRRARFGYYRTWRPRRLPPGYPPVHYPRPMNPPYHYPNHRR